MITRYFTYGRSKYEYEVARTGLEPTKITLLGKTFKESYRKQVDGLFLNEEEENYMKNLIPLLVLTEYITNGEYPVRLVTRGSNVISKTMTDVLNEFMNEHIETLKHILTIYKGDVKHV